jgi:hypothetical protein
VNALSLCAILAVLLLAPGSARATWLQFQEPARGSDNFTQAVHHLLLPTSGAPKGVLLVLPALDPQGKETATSQAEREGWPALANKLDFALMVSEFQGSETRDFSQARRGSGESVLRALRAFSDQTGQRDLSNANFAVYGVSTGAQFAVSFAQYKPDRVYGFVAVLGAYWEPSNAGGRKTPGLFISAPDQSDGAAERTRAYVAQAREYGGYWAWLQASSRPSAVSQSLTLAQEYLAGAVELRQSPRQSPTANPDALTPFKGWVIPMAGGSIQPSEQIPRDQVRSTFWYPSESTARMAESFRR